MTKPLFAVEYRQQGTTEKRNDAREERKKTQVTPWTCLVECFQKQKRTPVSFLFLAARRRTWLTPEEIAEELNRLSSAGENLTAADVHLFTVAAERRLKRRGTYARRFNTFLELADVEIKKEREKLAAAESETDRAIREQAEDVQYAYHMTFQEIGWQRGSSWQRAQQEVNEAMAELHGKLKQSAGRARKSNENIRKFLDSAGVHP